MPETGGSDADYQTPKQAGSYNVILIDPPWRFKTWSEKGEGKSASNHYSTMSMEDLAKIPIKEWAAPDCVMFLWVTWPLMEQILSPRIVEHDDGSLTVYPRLYESWGFSYSSVAWDWRKFNSDTGKYAMGLGMSGTRSNLEPCLLLRRGKPYLFDKSQRNFMETFEPDFLDAKRREHSRKPSEQFERIEKMFDGPYLEIFAREQRDGWDSWGNQTDMFNKPSE